MKNHQLEKASIKELTNLLIQSEICVRQQFFKCREIEIEGGKFEIKGVSLSTFLPSLREVELYGTPDYGPLGKIMITLNYRYKRKNKWTNKDVNVTEGIFGFDVKEDELEPFLRTAEKELSKLVLMMLNSWRNMDDPIEYFLNNRLFDNEYNLYAVSIENHPVRFIWAKNYTQLAEYVQSNVGKVRRMLVEIKKDMVGEATKTELETFFMTGEFGTATNLEDKLEKEKKMLEKQKVIQSMYA